MGLNLTDLNVPERKEEVKESTPIPTTQEIVSSKIEKEDKTIEEKKKEVIATGIKDLTTSEPEPVEKLGLSQEKGIIKQSVLDANPRLFNYPFMLSMFVEIIHWRIKSKKFNKPGAYVQATINGITIGIGIPKELTV